MFFTFMITTGPVRAMHDTANVDSRDRADYKSQSATLSLCTLKLHGSAALNLAILSFAHSTLCMHCSWMVRLCGHLHGMHDNRKFVAVNMHAGFTVEVSLAVT